LRTSTAVGHPYQHVVALLQATEAHHPPPDRVQGRGVAERAEDQACLLLLDKVLNAKHDVKVLLAPLAANGKYRFDKFRSHEGPSSYPPGSRFGRLRAEFGASRSRC
jgi:hypothetical protein